MVGETTPRVPRTADRERATVTEPEHRGVIGRCRAVSMPRPLRFGHRWARTGRGPDEHAHASRWWRDVLRLSTRELSLTSSRSYLSCVSCNHRAVSFVGKFPRGTSARREQCERDQYGRGDRDQQRDGRQADGRGVGVVRKSMASHKTTILYDGKNCVIPSEIVGYMRVQSRSHGIQSGVANTRIVTTDSPRNSRAYLEREMRPSWPPPARECV